MERHRRRGRVEHVHGPGVLSEGLLEAGPEAGTRGRAPTPVAPTRRGRRQESRDRIRALAYLAVGRDPGRHRPVVPEQVEDEAHLALAGVIVEFETTTASGQVIEGSRLLSLPDQSFGDGLPGGADAIPTVGVTPDGWTARRAPAGQWAAVMGMDGCRWLPQMGQTSVPVLSWDMNVAHPLVVHRSRRPAARSAAERRKRRCAAARCPSAVDVVMERVGM